MIKMLMVLNGGANICVTLRIMFCDSEQAEKYWPKSDLSLKTNHREDECTVWLSAPTSFPFVFVCFCKISLQHWLLIELTLDHIFAVDV